MKTLLILQFTQRVMGIRQNVLVGSFIGCRSDKVELDFTFREIAEYMPSQRRAQIIWLVSPTESQRYPRWSTEEHLEIFVKSGHCCVPS